VTFKDTKNKKTHSVPVNKHAMEILKTAQEMKVSDLVFPCDTGKYYHSFSRTWYRIRDKAGVNVRFHGLRHKDIKMTQRYSHIMNSALRKGTEVADELFR
jgi:integrase